MPYLKPERPEKVTAPSLKASKERGERLVCLTAYDYPTARIVDEAGIDIILVGDSLGNVVLGYGNTVPVTLEDILIHVKAVRRGVQRALLVADMPYGSFHTGADDTVRRPGPDKARGHPSAELRMWRRQKQRRRQRLP